VTLRQHKRLPAKPRTWRYSWDAEDRLTAVTTPDGTCWRYRYDPLGRRIAKQRLADDGTTVVELVDFTWDGVVLAEQTATTWQPDGAEPARRRTTVWEWEPGSFRPVSQTERSSLREALQDWIDEQFYAIVTDLVGTPTELIDPDGTITWQPRTTHWGTLLSTSASGANCPLRFPGQYFDDETQLHYNLFRYYDPTKACYLSEDPIGLAAGPNTRAYPPNPVTWIDPYGLLTCQSTASRARFSDWFAFWKDAGGQTQLRRLPGRWPRFQASVTNFEMPGTAAWRDTAAHEGFHALVARRASVVTWMGDLSIGSVPVGAPVKYAEETIAYATGHVAGGRLHGVVAAPLEAFGSLSRAEGVTTLGVGAAAGSGVYLSTR